MRRRLGSDVVLALLLPAACALALLALHPERSQPHAAAPAETPLTSSTVVCPAPLPGPDQLGVSAVASGAGTAAGEVQVGLGPAAAPLPVRGGRVSAAPPGLGAAVVTASGDLAPGLVAGRSRSAPLAAVDCARPVADQWFTAVGAGATHDSVVDLVNPNAGPAVADITIRSAGGVLDVAAVRGVAVPGGTSTQLDLAQVAPHRGDLALEVHVSRGQLAVHVTDTYDELGSGTRSQDWLPAQSEPAVSNVLLGLAKGHGERSLVLANPGADEVRATIKVITASSVFAPEGVEPVRVPPDTTQTVSLDEVLAQAGKDGATGVLVEASGPLTASIRQVVDGDLSLLAPAPALASSSAVVVPTGPKRLLLGAPDATGSATVTSYDADGKQLDQQQVDLVPDGGADLTLPDDAALVTLTPEQTSVRAALLLTGTGTAVVPFRELVLTGLVPDVRPGVP